MVSVAAALAAGCGSTAPVASEPQSAPQTPATLDAADTSATADAGAPVAAPTALDTLNQAFMEQAEAADATAGGGGASTTGQTDRLDQMFRVQPE